EALVALVEKMKAEDAKRSAGLVKTTSQGAKPLVVYDVQRAQWQALGLVPREEQECQLDKKASQSLAETAATLRQAGMVSTLGRDRKMDPPETTAHSYGRRPFPIKPDDGVPAAMVPALVQML